MISLLMAAISSSPGEFKEQALGDIQYPKHYLDVYNILSFLSFRFARLNPKMLVPSLKLDDGTIVNDSRACMKVMDKNCPKDQEEKVERILDIAYSCDLGWYSTVPLKKKVWLWYLMQESGLVSYFVCCVRFTQVLW